MKRIKRHKVKTEMGETSTSFNREQEVHDLAYYIHDRVELMHQVFSVLKFKELKAMVPASIRNISADDLQELCTEELLGISSKRLCAILDGADPPSDTESSSPSPPPEQMETISLDSISSDDEILSQTSNKKKKHKHRRHSRSKSKRKKSEQEEGEADKSKASRAGLTVLELLELQARARAIRAQLQQEQQKKSGAEAASKDPPHSSDNEVEIKEEPPEVVEISSDDEKPCLQELQNKITEEREAAAAPAPAAPVASVASVAAPAPQPQQTTVTKWINDLVIIVPQKTKQKIKLNRNKVTPSTTNKTPSVATTQKSEETPNVAIPDKTTENKVDDSKNVKKDKTKKKKKDKKNVSKDDIDNDEITLQLSDTEKMDLLEDLDSKHYDSVSSDSSSDSSSESDSEEHDGTSGKEKESEGKKKTGKEDLESKKESPEVPKVSNADDNNEKKDEIPEEKSSELITDGEKTDCKSSVVNTEEKKPEAMEVDVAVSDRINSGTVEVNLEASEIVEKIDSAVNDSSVTVAENSEPAIEDKEAEAPNEEKEKDTAAENEEKEDIKERERKLSEGELSGRESSEVEAVDLKPEVVCISDEEGSKKAKKKKKKREKKAKKDKKTKKSTDFCENSDQNFYKENVEAGEDSSPKETQSQASIEVIDNTSPSDTIPPSKTTDIDHTETIDKVDLTTAEKPIDNTKEHIKEEPITDQQTTHTATGTAGPSDEDIYEIMELSDDSSCCEVECTTTLSKEPTASEIEALSAKIDEIERVEIITDKEIREYEKTEQEKAESDNIEHISWKDRYLDSKKVKTVLSTASILNALRKKNIELKKKLAESKMEKVGEEQNVLEEGSIEHYNTLEALTTYVDPVKEVPKDLKKDAKLLLKMYKKLLKYNDINKPEDPNKKKKKKKKDKKIKKDAKKGKETEDSVANVANVESKEEDKE